VICAAKFLSRAIPRGVFADFITLVRPISTVVISIASESFRDTFACVCTFEHPWVAGLITVPLVRSVTAIVLSVADLEGPGAVMIGTLKLAHRADPITTDLMTRFVLPVGTIALAVTEPKLGDAFGVISATGELPFRAVCLTIVSFECELVGASTSESTSAGRNQAQM
jgi:hypothetical protein